MWFGLPATEWLLIQAAVSSLGLVSLAFVFAAGAAQPTPLQPTTRFLVCIHLTFICGLHGLSNFLEVLPNGIIRSTTELIEADLPPSRIAVWVMIFGWAAAVWTWVFVAYSFKLLFDKGWRDAKKAEGVDGS